MIGFLICLIIAIGIGAGGHFSHQPDMVSFYWFFSCCFCFFAGCHLMDFINKKEQGASQQPESQPPPIRRR